MLKSLKMPKRTIGENPLRFPVPTGGERGTVTVLCGPNGAGKSQILRNIAGLLWEGNAWAPLRGTGWEVEVEGDLPKLTLKPKHHTAQMASLGSLGVDRAAKAAKVSDDEFKLGLAVFGKLLRSAETPACVGDLSGLDLTRWKTDPTYRTEILARFPADEETAYPVRRDSKEVFKLFEDQVGGRLGLRRSAKGLQAVLSWPYELAASYERWSDGQKSLFTILMSVSLLEPDVYLFDEIENFFHPQMMSRAIEFLKTHVRQTILSSHHPHLIFGRAVDRVYYIELDRSSEPRYTFRVAKTQAQQSPPRKITEITTNLEKLASAYRLFDVRDAALLASAAYVQEGVDLNLNKAVLNAYECLAVPERAGVYVDRQTEEIANFIVAFKPSVNVVLDWGAGLGRVAAEMEKGVAGLRAADLTWVLYEPSEASRATWKSRSSPDLVNVKMIGTRADLQDVRAGVALLTNVLHVLNPTQWAEAIQDCWAAVKAAQSGLILVTEIFPLLAPERFAVPIPSEVLEQLLSGLGFRVHATAVHVHGATGYCLAASRPPESLPSQGEIVAQVEARWLALRDRLVRSYAGMPPPRSASDNVALLNAAFGVTRITQWFQERGTVGEGV